jgi:hypothetical protein
MIASGCNRYATGSPRNYGAAARRGGELVTTPSRV